MNWLAGSQVTEQDILRVAQKNGIQVGTKAIVLHIAGSMEGTKTYQLYNEELFKNKM